jgi:cystathionine beta-synthase
MIGGSAGGAVYAALTRLSELPPGSTVVTISCDSGEKYLDTVSNDDWMSGKGLLSFETEGEVGRLLDDHTPLAHST